MEEKNYRIGDWMNFYPGFHKVNLRFGPASYFDNRFYIAFSLGWGQFYIHIPSIKSKYYECDPPEYGFYFYSIDSWFPDSFWLCLGRKNKCFNMPWSLDWVRTSMLLKDGTWEHETKGNHKNFWEDEWKDKIWKEVHPYQYNLKNGEIQNRIAEIKVEEREWRPRWFKWTSLFKFTKKTIAIDFNEEVGERAGSWKGGVFGCSWELLPSETPLECLRRMEKERKL